MDHTSVYFLLFSYTVVLVINPPSVKPRPNFDDEIFENIKNPREIRILAAAGEKILTFQTLCKLDL